MFNSLAAKLAIVHLCYLGLIALLACTTLFINGQQEEDQLGLAYSERQSMLSQRMTQQLLGYAAKMDRGEEARGQRESAVSSMQVFENTLFALENGGLVPRDLQMAYLEEIPPAPEIVATQLRRVRDAYVPFRAHARGILNGTEHARREGVTYMVNNNSELLRELDMSTALFKVDVGKSVKFVTAIQKTAVIWGLMLTLALLFLARRLFIDPLAQLNEASSRMSRGEVTQPIFVDGPDEFRELGSNFERLRVAMRNFLGASASSSSL